MLRTEMNAGLKNILDALEKSEVSEVLESAVRREGNIEKNVALGAYVRYMQLFQKFGRVERSLLKTLDLESIHEIGLWATIIASDESSSRTDIHQVYNNMRFFQNHVPKILHLLERETDTWPEKAGAAGQAELAMLNVIVIEDKKTSAPSRIVLMLEAVQGLYEAAAAVVEQPLGDLCLVSCDSGSDKSFDFLGLAKIVQCVKEVVLSFWDKVVYFREDKTGKRLELIATSLPILESISDMKDAGKIESERAEILRRQVIQSVTKFAEAGVTIPEIEGFTTFNPRQLMRPEPKLLVAAKTDTSLPETAEEKAKTEAEEPLDPELQKYLDKMAKDFLKKRQKKDSQGHDEELESGAGEEPAQPEDPADKE